MNQVTDNPIFSMRIIQILLERGDCDDAWLRERYRKYPERGLNQVGWQDLQREIRRAVVRTMHSQPQMSAQLIVDIVHAVTPDSARDLTEILRDLHRVFAFFRFTPYMTATAEGRYALIAGLMLYPHTVKVQKDISNVLSDLAQRPFRLKGDAKTWNGQMEKLLFAPAWGLFYSQEAHNGAFIVEHVLRLMPPLAWSMPSAPAVPPLPVDLSM